MNTVDFSQSLSILKKLAKYHPHISPSDLDLFLKSNESNFLDNLKYVPFIYLIIQILEKSHQIYLELSNRDNEKINLLHNIKNEPTKAITNYLKKIEMANTLYSQIMFDDDTNYFPLIEQILNDFKNNPSKTIYFFEQNRDKLDLRGGIGRLPIENGYKDLYKRLTSSAWGGNHKENFIELKKEIIIDYHYDLLQAYPIITKDIKQIQKKLYVSASIKIFKLLQLAQFQIKPYRLQNYIEELFITLEYPIKLYPDRINEAYPFALYGKHYVYKYLAKDDQYHVSFTRRLECSIINLTDYCSYYFKHKYSYDIGMERAVILQPLIS